ncbi:MAG: hypothetical protein U9Q99_00345 [Nanoarchaeota archaeon]|nr:hypothetical protein [Nanoarchaeota archaeon]
MVEVNYTASVIIQGGYTLEKPTLDGKTFKYAKVFKELEEPMNYEEIISHNIEAFEKGTPIIPSIPFYLDLLEAGINNNDFKNFNRKKLRKNFINFHTAIEYYPEGKKDKIIHFEKTPWEIFYEREFTGENNLIKQIKDNKTIEFFSGKEINSLNNISNKINETDSYFWRLNPKPLSIEKKVGWFYADSDWLSLVAFGSLSGRRSVFLVELGEQLS